MEVQYITHALLLLTTKGISINVNRKDFLSFRCLNMQIVIGYRIYSFDAGIFLCTKEKEKVAFQRPI